MKIQVTDYMRETGPFLVDLCVPKTSQILKYFEHYMTEKRIWFMFLFGTGLDPNYYDYMRYPVGHSSLR